MDLAKTGQFIATCRKQKGLTQKEFAEKINVTDKAVSRWETGKGFPDVSLLISMARVLEVSVSEIILGESVSFESQSTKTSVDNALITTLNFKKPMLNTKPRVFSHIILQIVLTLVLLTAIVLEALPSGIKLIFAPSAEERIEAFFSYFSHIPFGYGHFAPLPTAILTISVTAMSILSLVLSLQEYSLKNLQKTMLVCTALTFSLSLFSLFCATITSTLVALTLFIALAIQIFLFKKCK